MRPHRIRGSSLLVVLWTLAGGSGCGGGRPSEPTAAVESLVPRARTAHFDVHAGQAAETTVTEIAAALESRYIHVTSDLETGEVARITVEVWSDEASFLAEMERFLGRRYNATHEMSHAISLRVNATFANRPRWLWESVALFENDELVDPRGRSRTSCKAGSPRSPISTPIPTRAARSTRSDT